MNIKKLLKEHNDNFVLAILLILFIGYSCYIAIHLKPGIIPDEPAHFIFAKHYSTTLGIPPDTFETYSWGWYIEQNPFLYHWVFGRAINVINLFQPDLPDQQLLIALRLINVFFAIGTALFCSLLAREVIKDKWWRILPTFLLTNTLMFVFLAGGVNYDNLANFLSMAGLYFLIRAFNLKTFITSSLLWMVFIALGTLVKYPLLPLALAMTTSWVIFLFLKHKSIPLSGFLSFKPIFLTICLSVLFLINFSIYGINLIRHQTLLPPCREILLEYQCKISPYEDRFQEIAFNPKLTIAESIDMGFPNPIKYAGFVWPQNMLLRTFGVVGHKSYFPLHLTIYFQILFYTIGVLSLARIFSLNRPQFSWFSLFGISFFYAITLLITNYNAELVYGFLHIGFQGRYIFPVIGAIYIFITSVFKWIPFKTVRWSTLAFTLILFLYSGPITLIFGYDTIFRGWFL